MYHPHEEIAERIEELLVFALEHLWLEPEDVVDARNKLLDLFQFQAPAKKVRTGKIGENPAEILKPLVDYAVENDLIADSTTSRDLYEARIMGLLIPRPSEVNRRFRETEQAKSIEEATRTFYAFSKASHYIRMDRIRKNQHWRVNTPYGHMEITINLSKPEKDPREIAAVKSAPALQYPQCVLCCENVGYAGRIDHPARQNLRVIPLTLADGKWYFQYSPYMYYEEHSIVLYENHVPMRIQEKTFQALFDFVDRFPHYFIGSNADLPIVGGSILHHDHYQAGRHTFPMNHASVTSRYIHNDFPEVQIFRLNWPLTVIRTRSHDREALQKFANHVLSSWRQYSDPGVDIVQKHNTITPIARKMDNEQYELDLILRNNRTSAEYPEGIFHPHRELHAIKKENIGLIEVMGLAVLPGRLNEELKAAENLLSHKNALAKLQALETDEENLLHKHLGWLTELYHKYEGQLTHTHIHDILHQEVGLAFATALEHCGVFKWNNEGISAFSKWMGSIGVES